MNRILIMGLPGSGKTTFAFQLRKALPNYIWLSADIIRQIYNDWDFTYEGRIRQAKRMKELSDGNVNSIVDFVCPLPEMRDIINGDIIVWMDTIQESRYEDTNKLFVQPDKYTYHITSFEEQEWSNVISKIISSL